MEKREPVVIGGQPVGRLRASWLLFIESWRYLRSDKEMIWIPFVTTILNLFLFGIIVALFVFIVLGGDVVLSKEGEPLTSFEWAFIFLFYVVGAFTLALSQAGVTHTVHTRVHGGDATFSDSIKVAFSLSGSLFVWSVITSTVGIILRMLAERSKLLGKIVLGLIGMGWAVLTYFVVPAIVIDKLLATTAIRRSGQVFRATWGETIVSNVSLGLVFLVAHLLVLVSFIGLVFLVSSANMQSLVFLLIALYVVWVVVASLVQATLEGILKTLLYIYAAEGVYPPNFNQELLERMLSRRNPVSSVEQSIGQATI